MIAWFVKAEDGHIRGPFREHQIRQRLAAGEISPGMSIRQGDSPWIAATQVRRIFASLDQQGYYIKSVSGEEFGPFTKNRFDQLRHSGELPATYWFRQSTSGTWSFVNHDAPTNETTASLVPDRAEIPAAPVMKLRERSWVQHLWSNMLPRSRTA